MAISSAADFHLIPVPDWAPTNINGIEHPIVFPDFNGFIVIDTDSMTFGKLIKAKRGQIGDIPEQTKDDNINVLIRNYKCIIKTSNLGIVRHFVNNVEEFLIRDHFDNNIRVASIDNDTITYQPARPEKTHTSFDLTISGKDIVYPPNTPDPT